MAPLGHRVRSGSRAEKLGSSITSLDCLRNLPSPRRPGVFPETDAGPLIRTSRRPNRAATGGTVEPSVMTASLAADQRRGADPQHLAMPSPASRIIPQRLPGPHKLEAGGNEAGSRCRLALTQCDCDFA